MCLVENVKIVAAKEDRSHVVEYTQLHVKVIITVLRQFTSFYNLIINLAIIDINQYSVKTSG